MELFALRCNKGRDFYTKKIVIIIIIIIIVLIIIYIALFSYSFIALYNNYVIVEPKS